MKRILLILGLLYGLTVHAQTREVVIDEVVAVVGANVILKSDVEKELRLQRRPNINESQLRCQIFENMLFQKLLLIQAETDSLTVTDDQVENALTFRLRDYTQMFGSQEKLEEYYGMSMEAIRNDIRPDLRNELLVDMVKNDLVKDIKVTPADTRRFFNTLPPDSVPLVPAEFELVQIVKNLEITQQELADTRRRAQELRERIVKGESFTAMAALYSEDIVSARKGGEVGLLGRGFLQPEYEVAAFNLEPGQVSEVIKTKFGFHIIQLIERRGELYNTRHILLMPKVNPEEINKAANQLDSIAEQVRAGSLTFEEAVMKFSDSPTKNNHGLVINPVTLNSRFKSDEIDPRIADVVANLEEGEISRPVGMQDRDDMTQSVNLYYVKKKYQPHRANLNEDYSLISNWALNQKQNEVLNKWIGEKISGSYFKIHDDFKYCNFNHDWTIR